MSRARRWRTTSSEQTAALGQALGRLLHPGDLVALSGPLGSGKTQFVKGMAVGLEVPAEEPAVSPTFVLVREYVGRLRLYHVDAYRLRGGSELLALGLDEMLDDPQGVVAVEWADRVAGALPSCAWRIALAHVDEHTRAIAVSGSDAARLAALATAWREIRRRPVDRRPD